LLQYAVDIGYFNKTKGAQDVNNKAMLCSIVAKLWLWCRIYNLLYVKPYIAKK